MCVCVCFLASLLPSLLLLLSVSYLPCFPSLLARQKPHLVLKRVTSKAAIPSHAAHKCSTCSRLLLFFLAQPLERVPLLHALGDEGMQLLGRPGWKTVPLSSYFILSQPVLHLQQSLVQIPKHLSGQHYKQKGRKTQMERGWTERQRQTEKEERGRRGTERQRDRETERQRL